MLTLGSCIDPQKCKRLHFALSCDLCVLTNASRYQALRHGGRSKVEEHLLVKPKVINPTGGNV